MRTIEEAKEWASKNQESIRAGFEIAAKRDPSIISMSQTMPEVFKQIWDSGCWMQEECRKLGFSEEEIKGMQFECGRRSFGDIPWEVSVDYVNDLIEKKN